MATENDKRISELFEQLPVDDDSIPFIVADEEDPRLKNKRVRVQDLMTLTPHATEDDYGSVKFAPHGGTNPLQSVQASDPRVALGGTSAQPAKSVAAAGLVNDLSIPGNYKVYGTDASGTRGWRDTLWTESVGQDAIQREYRTRMFPSVAAMEADTFTNAFTNERVELLGYYALGDGGGGLFYVDKTDTTTASNGYSVIVAADGTRLKRTKIEAVNVLEVGAKGDRVTDDLARLQVAFDYAQANDLGIVMPRMCYVSGSIVVNRSANSKKYLEVSSRSGGGFYVTTAIPVFTSTTTYTTDPVSNLIRFSGLTFECNSGLTNAFVLDGNKFMRVAFDDCNFYMIRCLVTNNTTQFTQSIYFDRCNGRAINGTFFDSPFVSFDIKVSRFIYEASDNFFQLGFPVGCSFIANLVEGLNGFGVKYWGASGVSINGNYFEQNSGADIDGTAIGAETSYGVDIRGNYFSRNTGVYTPTSEWSVIWGACVACASEGNSGWKLHQLAASSRVRIADSAVTSVSNIANYYSPPTDFPMADARAASIQSITNATDTTVTLGNIVADPTACFSANKFTPKIAGYYKITAKVFFSTNGGALNRCKASIYKSGGVKTNTIFDFPTSPGADFIASGSCVMQLNGTTDYVTLQVYMTGSNLQLNYNTDDDASTMTCELIRPI